jgi:hypothetical protein
MSIETEIHEFHNFGYLKSVIPTELSATLLSESNYIQNNFDKSVARNAFLAGHMKHEYQLESSVDMLERYILNLSTVYDKHYDYFKQIDMLTKDVPIVMKNPWINFQAKHEFNPLHNHKGLLSFVIWLKIPYDLEREFKEGPGARRGADAGYGGRTSIFEFAYVNSLGSIATHPIKVDKSYENNIIMFPSKMMHCVYPFYTSDEYRISVSGNIMLQTG